MTEGIEEATVVASTDTYAHPLMNELMEALTLPIQSKVPPTWQPPKPSFLKNAAIDAEEVVDEASKEVASEVASGNSSTAVPDVENVHTAYGTAKQWTKNVDHVMSGLCKWLNGADSRDPYRADAEDFVFMQRAIGAYLQTLSINLDPKAAMYAAIIVVYIGHVGTGVVYRGKQLWTWAVKEWKERKAKKAAEAKAARAEATRKRTIEQIMEALHNPNTSAKEAEALANQAIDLANDGVIEVDAETIDDEGRNPYEDPDFRPRPTDPEAISLEELKGRRANRFCLYPVCDKRLKKKKGGKALLHEFLSVSMGGVKGRD